MAEKMKPRGIDWIGDIPINWKCSKVKFCFSLVNGSTPDSSDYDCWDGDIRWITPADMSDTGTISQGERFITKYGYNSCGTTLLPAGSIVVSSRAPIGKINITTAELCTNQGCKSLIRTADNRYFYYLFLAGQNELSLLGRGTTFLELSTYDLNEFGIVIPAEDEQKAIADFLDKECAQIDSIAADLEKQIALLQQYKKSLITETVTKGLDKSVPMKDSGVEWIGEIPEHWRLKRLKYIAKLKTGTTPPGNEGINYDENGINWFTPSDFLPNMQLDTSEKYIDRETIRYANIQTYPRGSVLLVAIGATVGKIGISKNNAYSNQQITAVIPQHISGNYLLYYLASKSPYIKDNALYTTLPIINNSYLQNITIVVPPTTEQEKIVEFLNRKCSIIDELIEDKNKLLLRLQQHKKSLIYEYVTGKKRVKEVR